MRYSPSDFVDADDIAAAKARSPHARQNCVGSMKQLMVDAGSSVSCAECGKSFTLFTTQKNRDRTHPIVPSHLPDFAGAAAIAQKRAVRNRSSTPRPY